MGDISQVKTPEELEHVRSLFREYQVELPANLRFPDSEWRDLPGEYRPPRGTLLLATVKGQPAGCVGLRPFPMEGACEMKRLYVRVTFRGDKLGRALGEKLLHIARQLGYTRMRLDTHPATMQRALELYRQFGFREVAPDPMSQVLGLSYMEIQL